MRKSIFLLVLVALIAGMSSCGKSYVCTCTATGITNDSLYWIPGNQQINNTSHKHAVDDCNGWQSTMQAEMNANGEGGTVKCSI